MKIIVFFVIFAFLTTSVFADRPILLLNDAVNTSEGWFSVVMYWYGRNMGQYRANQQANNPMTSRVPSLSRGQSEAIWNALARYNLRTGDTFLFFLISNPHARSSVVIAVVVEMVTSEQFKFWAFSLGLN